MKLMDKLKPAHFAMTFLILFVAFCTMVMTQAQNMFKYIAKEVVSVISENPDDLGLLSTDTYIELELSRAKIQEQRHIQTELLLSNILANQDTVFYLTNVLISDVEKLSHTSKVNAGKILSIQLDQGKYNATTRELLLERAYSDSLQMALNREYINRGFMRALVDRREKSKQMIDALKVNGVNEYIKRQKGKKLFPKRLK